MYEDESLLQACMRTIVQQTFHQAYWKAFEIKEADSDELKDKAFRLRYQVYKGEGPAEGLSDEMSAEKIEKDIYDDRALHYLLIHRATGQTAGTVRILRPRASDPLQSFELQSMSDHPLLANEQRVQHMCEISRLCMAWQFRRRPKDGKILPAYYEQEVNSEIMPLGKPLTYFRRRITYAPLGLMMAAFKAVMDVGILDCVSMMDPADFRSLKRLGFNYKILGPRVGAQGLQPIIFNIKNVLDSMTVVNPECWEVISDKGRLDQRASELQLETWHENVFDAVAERKILSQFF